jgi:hypothetical protein
LPRQRSCGSMSALTTKRHWRSTDQKASCRPHTSQTPTRQLDQGTS